MKIIRRHVKASIIKILALNDHDLVARGKQRAIYIHPTDTTKLVKVLLKQPQVDGRSAFGNFMERSFPSVRARHIQKEYWEYLRLMLANQDPEFQPPITHMYGFTATKQGLGCLTENVVGPDGQLADTLHGLIEKKAFAQNHLDMLNNTLARIYALDIRASDLTSCNIVFGRRDTGGGLGNEECVLVDGFGDIHAIPIRSMAAWSNRLGLDDSCKRLARNNNLQWDQRKRAFTH